jgi:hypothetical protein
MHNGYTDPYTIQVAPHGWEQVTLAVNAPAAPVTERGFAPRNNRTLRAGHNDHLSALVTLHEYWDLHTHERRLALRFYHNPYAAVKFEPAWWAGEQIHHLQMSSKTERQYQDWVSASEAPDTKQSS